MLELELEKKPKYKQWVEENFTGFFLENKNDYVKLVDCNFNISNDEYNNLEEKFCNYSLNLKKNVPEIVKIFNVDPILIYNEIDYWVGAYLHGQLDVLYTIFN